LLCGKNIGTKIYFSDKLINDSLSTYSYSLKRWNKEEMWRDFLFLVGVKFIRCFRIQQEIKEIFLSYIFEVKPPTSPATETDLDRAKGIGYPGSVKYFKIITPCHTLAKVTLQSFIWTQHK